MATDPSPVITAVATLVVALTGLLGAAVAAVVTLRRKSNGNGAQAKALAKAFADALDEARAREQQ